MSQKGIELTKAQSLDEELIVGSMGYLRVPHAFKAMFGGVSAKRYPAPRASMVDKEGDEEIHLIFSFPRSAMEQLKKKEKEEK